MKRKTHDCNEVNPLVSAILTDNYQLTTAYASFLQGRHEVPAVYNMFFRRNPFVGGEYTIFAGLEEVLSYLENFHFSSDDIEYIREAGLPGCRDNFYTWLAGLTSDGAEFYAPPEGTIVFPQEPLFTCKSGAAFGRLIETAVLNLTGFASLAATEASRMRAYAGSAFLAEFGLRRAQGPNGGLTASRSAYIGGFDSTSNMLAGKLYGIPASGTMSHAFIQEHAGMDLDDIPSPWLENACGNDIHFADMVLNAWVLMGSPKTNRSELAAFTAFAVAFPENFLALVDTYSTLESGVPNYVAVSLALHECGYSPRGIRLDSGDLVRLSNKAREMFREFAARPEINFSKLSDTPIMASNDIGEKELKDFRVSYHSMNGFGIGTKIATCDAQPALGMVYKLVEINGRPVAKRSEERGKSTFPGQKQVWRLSGFENDKDALIDIIALWHEEAPRPGSTVGFYHPDNGKKDHSFVPSKVETLVKRVFTGESRESLCVIRDRARNGLEHFSPRNRVFMSEALWEMTRIARDE